jgi:hypothetical protein
MRQFNAYLAAAEQLSRERLAAEASLARVAYHAQGRDFAATLRALTKE